MLAHNGNIGTIFKYFNQAITVPQLPNLVEFFRTAEMIIIQFHSLIHMESAYVTLVVHLLGRANALNVFAGYSAARKSSEKVGSMGAFE